MTKPIIRINDNGNIIDREMTDDEFAQYEIDLANEELKRTALAEAQAAKGTALAKLAVLGLDLDDLSALGF